MLFSEKLQGLSIVGNKKDKSFVISVKIEFYF